MGNLLCREFIDILKTLLFQHFPLWKSQEKVEKLKLFNFQREILPPKF